MYKYVFFDLDGTLTQSEFGIINSIVYALNKMGIDVEDRETVKRFIGPPLIVAFKDFYQMSDEDAEKAAGYYRECYKAGEMYNAPLYDGIEETLRKLKEAGKVLYVVTSKPTVFASRIVEHYNIDKYFEDVIGPDLSDKSYTKDELVAAAMAKTTDGEPVLSEYLMVGDRYYDIDGAKANGIDSMGVLFGYGTREELEKAGATHIVETPEDISPIAIG
ncbi:MAG: HAD hydrolase-like protein [Eubacterium sp.]|nr:HAD hydrolase-like protein [Eubacterium sp.]